MEEEALKLISRWGGVQIICNLGSFH